MCQAVEHLPGENEALNSILNGAKGKKKERRKGREGEREGERKRKKEKKEISYAFPCEPVFCYRGVGHVPL